MVINHNEMAANTARNLNSHYGRLQTSTQRLSTGLRINSAADDAAGLAIRELMRSGGSQRQLRDFPYSGCRRGAGDN